VPYCKNSTCTEIKARIFDAVLGATFNSDGVTWMVLDNLRSAQSPDHATEPSVRPSRHGALPGAIEVSPAAVTLCSGPATMTSAGRLTWPGGGQVSFPFQAVISDGPFPFSAVISARDISRPKTDAANAAAADTAAYRRPHLPSRNPHRSQATARPRCPCIRSIWKVIQVTHRINARDGARRRRVFNSRK